jgi:hypothetical protein
VTGAAGPSAATFVAGGSVGTFSGTISATAAMRSEERVSASTMPSTEERGGSRRRASLKVWRKILEGLVAAERAAILQLIGRLCIANCCGHDQCEGNGISDDLAHELRVIARLMETKALKPNEMNTVNAF